MNFLQRRIRILLLIASSLTASIAFGFDNIGHMAVAGLAYDELTVDQRAHVVAILKNHPYLEFITEGFPDGNVDGRDLVMAAATWPDLARGHVPQKGHASGDGGVTLKDTGYEENDPAVKEVKYNDGLLHRGWHFIDKALPVSEGSSLAPTQLPSTPAVNAVGVVNVLKAQLKSNEDDKERAYDIAWLMHLVGDLHQPLHAVNGISQTLPNGDKGGNLVVIKGYTNGAAELHAFWDDVLGKTAAADRKTHHPRLDRDIATANRVIVDVEKLPLGKDADNLDPAVWASESFKLAQQDGYDLRFEPTTVERPGQSEPAIELEANISEDYAATAKADASKQVRMAGHRLMKVLQDSLASQ
jgi:hypothetical protein